MITRRCGLFRPIIKYYDRFYPDYRTKFIFELKVLSNNLNRLFGNTPSDKEDPAGTKKKVRKHTIMYELQHSNKKIDSLMLMNTLYAYLKNRKYINVFKDSIVWSEKNDRFEIQGKKFVFENRAKKKIGS